MVGPFLRETTVLIVFCHIFVNGADLLEAFRPNPSLPEELNQWLTDVQEHENDFRLIRDSVGEEPKSLFHFDEDYEYSKKDEDYDHIYLKDNVNNKNTESLSEKPQNDIYPHMFLNLKDNGLGDLDKAQFSKEKPQNDIYPYMYQNLQDNGLGTFDKTQFNKERLTSKNIRSPIRLRRSNDVLPFFELKNCITIAPIGKTGELKRSGDKYPDSYNRNEEESITDTNNITQGTTYLKYNDVKKREIQIDIKNDGKIVKQIHEDTKIPKSIVVNIQSPTNNPLMNAKAFEPYLNFEKGFQQNSQNQPNKIRNLPDTNVRSDYSQLRNKEFINYYNNLFTANEHLNTDHSLAHESSTINHLNPHAAVPDENSQLHNYETAATENTNYMNDKQFLHKNNFNNNNMKDMSSFWSTYEKNQLQKGLDRARINKNYLARNVKLPLKDNEGKKVKESPSGFEPAQRIELDDDANENSSARGISNIDDKNQMSYLKTLCDTTCNNNGMNNPSCNACMNRMNSINNLNNPKDMNMNNINTMNNPNDAKLMNGLNSSNALVSPNGMSNINSLNGFNFDLGINRRENNKFSGYNDFSNLQSSSKINNKRQLVVPEGSLQLINDNSLEQGVDFANFTGDNDVDFLDTQYIEKKRGDVLLQNDLFERVHPLEKDSTTVSLNEELSAKPIEEDHNEPVSLDDSEKKSDEIIISDTDIKSPLNNIEEIGNLSGGDLNENEVLVEDKNELIIITDKPATEINESSSKEDLEPVDTIESEVSNDPLDEVHEVYEKNPLPKGNPVLSTRRHHNKHIKTLIRKLNKDLMNANRVTEVETITEIYYTDTDENENIEQNIKAIENDGGKENEHLHVEVVPNADLNKIHNAKEPLIMNEKNKDHNGKELVNVLQKESLVDADSCSENKANQEDEHINEEDMDADSYDELQTNIKKTYNEKPNDHGRQIAMDINEPRHSNGKLHEEIHNPVSHENHLKNEVNMTPKRNHFGEESCIQHSQKRRKIHQRIPQKILFIDKPYDIKNRQYFDKTKFSHNSHNYIDSPSPAELIIKRRDNSDTNHLRKRYRKRYHNDKTFFDNFDSEEYDHILREESDIDTSSSANDLIPAFIGRQLKEVDYVYDPYLYRPGVDFDEELSTALEEFASEKSHYRVPTRKSNPPKKGHHSKPLHKNSAEGDYNEEEDSVTEARKKTSKIIIKKTKNEFANPVTTTEMEDYDNYDNYDSVSSTKKEKLQPKHHPRKHKNGDKKKGAARKIRKPPTALKEHDVRNFGHHRQKYKPKIKKKHPRSTFSNKLLSPLYQPDMNKFSNQKLFDAKSDFQHWPSFVIDDRDNEEKLRKRSPIMKKKYPRTFNFPLSSKDFFVKSQKKPGSSAVKREKPNTLLDEENLSNDSSLPQVDINKTFTKEKGNSGETTTGLDEDTETCTESSQTNACEDKENFNKTYVEITTILSIAAPETLSDMHNACNDALDFESENVSSYERLDDILNGKLPFHLVDTIMKKLSKNTKLKDRFHKGLKHTGPDKNIIQSLNETNKETRKLLQSVTNIMNKLQHSATCQSIPRSLKRYLKIITHGAKLDALAKTRQMEEVEFDENQSQDNFIFQSSSQGDNFEGKVKILEDLLAKFNKLPEKCKARALPVKEYIENHLGMLNNMLNTTNKGHQKNLKPKKSIQNMSHQSVKTEDELIEEQLESLGLGKEHKFKPKFDLDEMVENNKLRKASSSSQSRTTEQSQNVNVNKRDLKSVSRSKYDKLVDAVRKLRLRREGRKRLAEMYGRSRRDSSDYEQVHYNSKFEGDENMSKANFETPLVFSL